MEIDWSKAPEWATRFCHVGMNRLAAWANDTQYTYVVGGLAGRIFKIGTDEGFPESAMHTIECSPAAWTGTGLPPVGTVCEMQHSVSGIDSDWIMAKINYSSPHNIVATSIDGGIEFVAFTRRSQFRPIRTEAQIAAEERENAIQQMIEDADYDGKLVRGLFAKLHDAGYRKTEAP